MFRSLSAPQTRARHKDKFEFLSRVATQWTNIEWMCPGIIENNALFACCL